jgi:DNA-binding transcriptional regulator YhcF (GntR family)
MPPRTRENLVDTVTEALVLRILRGELPAGSKLPSVRALAAEHGVNVSTVQRVLVRLEEMRVVVARPRSGVEVRDPERHGGSALWPVVLKHAGEHRELAIAVVRDALAARRTLAIEVVKELSAVPHARYGRALEQNLAVFARAVAARPRDLLALFDSENDMARTVLAACSRPALLAIFNDIAALLLGSEPVLEALGADADQHLFAWHAFARVLAGAREKQSFDYLEPLLRAQDERVVARFARALESKPASVSRARTARASTRRSS